MVKLFKLRVAYCDQCPNCKRVWGLIECTLTDRYIEPKNRDGEFPDWCPLGDCDDTA